MNYFEVDFIPISALQHYAFCERQCALIHIEQVWAENILTTQGKLLHEKVDTGQSEQRKDLFIARSLRIRSNSLGLSGIADVVEFFRSQQGVSLSGREGLWQPCPIEYKRGQKKSTNIDRIQLCAQVICLEEMFGLTISKGALYYAQPNRREWVQMNDAIRTETATVAKYVHELIHSGRTPLPIFEKKCRNCSLMDLCQPNSDSNRADHYFKSLFKPGDL